MSETTIIQSTLQHERYCFQISSGTITVIFPTPHGELDRVTKGVLS